MKRGPCLVGFLRTRGQPATLKPHNAPRADRKPPGGWTAAAPVSAARAPAKWRGVVRGTPVEFPFDPYACQLDFMDTALGAVDAGASAILESPTGTGKTLCLLVSTLAWAKRHAPAQTAQADHGGPPPERRAVVYASRTHAPCRNSYRKYVPYSREDVTDVR